MDQITGNPRSHDEGTSGWKFAHQRLSQMLMEEAIWLPESDYEGDAPGTGSPRQPHYVVNLMPMTKSEVRRL